MEYLPAADLPGGRHRGAVTALFALGCALVVAYAAAPSESLPLRLAAGVWAVYAFTFGLRRYRPRHAEAWLLLAASVAVFQIGDASDFGLPVSSRPAPSDWISFVGYPLAAAGLVLMVRARTIARDLAGLLDALVAAIALGFPAWVFLVQPFVGESGLSPAVRTASILPPIGDLVLLGIIARLLTTSATRNLSIWLLAVGVTICAAADACEALWRLEAVGWFGTPAGQDLVAGGWMGFCLLWGAAALVPSMWENTVPARGQLAGVLPARIALLIAIVLVVPTVALAEHLRGHRAGWQALVIGTSVTVLIMLRVGLVLADHRRALDNEQSLLAASEALASASSADEVAAGLRAAVDRLFRPRTQHRAVIAAVCDGRLRVITTGSDGSADRHADPPGNLERAGFGDSADDSGSDRDLACWHAVFSDTTFSDTTRRAPPETDAAGLVRTADLPPAMSDTLAGFEQAAAYPLTATSDDRSDAAWSSGVIVIAAREHDLLQRAALLEILAGQAALSLNRIELNREIARRDGRRYFQTLVQNDSDAILIVGADARIRYASPSAEALFGCPDITRRSLGDLLGPQHAAEVTARLADPVRHPPTQRDWRVRSTSGAAREAEATISDLRDEPTVAGLVLALRDVTEAREMDRALYRLAFRDELTGLPNRAAFLLELEGALAAAADGRLHLVLVDLDNFREINDAHGRDLGDEVLRAAAAALRAHLAPHDVLARVGADEFAILLHRPAAGPGAFPSGIPDERWPTTVGPAVVSYSGAIVDAEPGATAGSLLADAEITLHAAKQSGRPHSWRRYDPVLRTDLEHVATLRSRLAQALDEDEFVLVYQPIVDMASRAVAGFESLVRWPQRDGGVLSPDAFVPLAEATGQILPLGRWILRTAMAQAAAWNRMRAAAGRSPVRITVNVSAHEVRAAAFPDAVAEELRASGLDPDLLVLEATESVLIRSAGPAQANLRATAALGVRLALDDFGTGYSSLSYLRDLPVTALKIDKSFVREITESRRQLAIVEGIIGIGHALDLTIIAEGIETEDQYRRLTKLGADRGQGYLFGKPMPPDQAEIHVLR